MDLDFWRRRWRKNEIAFHQREINTHLQRFWSQLELPPGRTVFVPLCGKSLDMLWLAGQGHPVLGVDISQIALASFFQENELTAHTRQEGAFEVWETQDITLLCGDFFALDRAALATIGGVYDRASLIALPPPMRRRYADHLKTILPPAAPVLLLTLEYSQEQMQGPPFSVETAEAQALYEDVYTVELLACYDVLAENPRFHDRLTRLEEKVYRLMPTIAPPNGSA